MSDNNNIQNEQDLWDVLSEPVTTESKPPKAPKPKANPEGRFAKPDSVQEPVSAGVGRRVDGFFLACMAGVAAVAVTATLLISSMLGGSTPAAGTKDPVKDPANVPGETVQSIQENDDRIAQLEQENAELRAQLELQKEQVKDLQKDLMQLMGSEQYLSTMPTGSDDPDDPDAPDAGNETLDQQRKAMETLAQIQEAYADFDRARLEELIPQMDELLGYLSPDALNNYYVILEYVEQPSNG